MVFYIFFWILHQLMSHKTSLSCVFAFMIIWILSKGLVKFLVKLLDSTKKYISSCECKTVHFFKLVLRFIWSIILYILTQEHKISFLLTRRNLVEIVFSCTVNIRTKSIQSFVNCKNWHAVPITGAKVEKKPHQLN